MSDSRDELRKRFDAKRSESAAESVEDPEEVDDQGDTGNTGDAENVTDGYDWGDKYNYPFYVPREFAEELDALYNRYDGKNKIEGGDGLEKHREFLFPIMQAAIEELDLEEVVDWEPDDDSE